MSKLVKGGSGLPQPPQHQQQPDQKKVRGRERKEREERSGDMQSRMFISLFRSVALRDIVCSCIHEVLDK